MRFRPRIVRAAPSHISEAVSPTWRTSLYATCIAQATAMIGFGFVLPFLALYLKELHVGDEHAVELWSGALVASTAVSLAIVSPIWGAVADRRGRKLMVLRAMLAGGLVLGLMAFVQNAWELLVLRILQGGVTGTVAASTALVATIAPRDRLAYSMGLLQTSIYLGITGGPLLGGILAQLVGIRGTFIVAGVLLALGGLLIWLFVHEHVSPATGVSPTGYLRAIRTGIGSPVLAPLLVVLLLIQVSSAIVFPILPLYVEHLSRPGDPVDLFSGLAFGTTAVFSALAAVFYHRLVVRTGYRRLLIAACLLAAAFFAPQALAANIGQLLALRAGLGIFFGVLIPATNAIVGLSTARAVRGSAYGLTSSATALGNAIGPLIGSLVAAAVSINAIFLATAGVLSLLAVWVAALVREPQTIT